MKVIISRLNEIVQVNESNYQEIKRGSTSKCK